MYIRDVEKLKVWLLKKLEPLCDADPAALAKYIVALLRKDKPRSSLRELCVDQLEVFLAKDTPQFVDVLFSSLDSESYMSPGRHGSSSTNISNNNQQSSNTGGAGDGHGDGRVSPSYDRRISEDSRHKEVDDDDRDFRRARRGGVISRDSSPHTGGVAPGPKKGRTNIEPPRRTVRQRVSQRAEERSGRNQRGRSRSRSRSTTPDLSSIETTGGGGGDGEKGEKGKKRDAPSGGKVDGGIPPPPTKKQRCKDYDEKGVCMLGEQCPYDHGVDPLVISPITGGLPPYAPPPFPLLPPQMPSMSKANTGLLLSTITPRHPPPPPPTDTDGYNPEDPAITSTAPPSILPPPPPPMLPHLQMRPGFPPPPSLPGIPPFHPPLHPHPPSLPPPNTNQHMLCPVRPFHGHSHNNRGGGQPGQQVGGARIPSRPSDSIVLHKVPRQLNTITKLSGHFEKFGSIVNLQVRYDGDPESALVQFSSPAEAKAAHDCVEAVLNNRFIKVYYLKKGPGQWGGKKGDQPPVETATSTPGAIALATIRPDAVTQPPLSSSSSPQPQQTSSQTAHHNNTKHTSTYTNSLSAITMQAHHKKPPPPSAPLVSSTPVSSSVPATVPTEGGDGRAPAHVNRTVVPSSVIQAAEKRLQLQQKTQKLLQLQIQQQKLLLNKLEKSGKTLSSEEKSKVMETLRSLSSSINKLRDTLASATKTASIKDPARKQPRPQKDQTSPADTVAQSDSLQMKATQLRNEARKLGILPESGTQNAATAPGGGAGEWTGKRKGDLRTKLDSKPRQLIVVDAKDKDALTAYFDSFGGLNQVEVDPDNSKNLIFTFRTRGIAEKAVRNGSVFQGTPLIMKWYTPKPPPPPPAPPSPSSTSPVSAVPFEENGQLVKERPKLVLNLEATQQEEKPLPQRRMSSISPSLDSLLLSPDATATNPRVVHLVEDDEEEEERSWRR